MTRPRPFASAASFARLILLLACIAVFLVLSGCTTGPTIAVDPPTTKTHVTLPPGVDATVQIDRSGGYALPPRFLGLSVEARALCHILALSETYSGFARLLRNLGPGVIHVGGRSTDLALWRPNGTAYCSAKHSIISLPEVRALVALLRRVGWKVLWELPLERYDPSRDAQEAIAISHIAGPLLDGWTIGNEPDLYVKSGFRPLTWGYVQYFHQWEATRRAVVTATPGIPFSGPDTCCNPLVFSSFAADARGRVSALSLHQYAGSLAGEKHPVQYLLGPELKLHAALVQSYAWQDSAGVDRVPLYITEANTFPAGGVGGVSDRYVAALWLSDFLFQALTHHFSQVDVQQSRGNDFYNPIGPGARPRAAYYGMSFFRIAGGTQGTVLPVQTNGPGSFSGYAVRQGPHNLSVILVNRTSRSLHVLIRFGRPFRPLARTVLSAPGITARVGRISIRTAPWKAAARSSESARSSLTIVVPRCEALALRVHVP